MRTRMIASLAGALAAMGTLAHADHARPGLFTDIGNPPAKGEPAQGGVAAQLLVERCTAFVKSIRTDKDGRIRDYEHNYKAGFCLGWINASMAFMNFRDAEGAEMLGVCLPEGIDTKVVAETFLDFAKRHDDDMIYNPSFLIYWSLLEKYPCKHQ